VTHAEIQHIDTTEHRRAEEERERTLNMSYDLICAVGADGYLKYVNPARERTLGYSKEELLARLFHDFIHPDDHQKNGAKIANLSVSKQTVGFENS
jgi:PAS domain S-box-containing protein